VDLCFATSHGHSLRADRHRLGAESGFAGAIGYFVSADWYLATTSLSPAIADRHLPSADKDPLIADACFATADGIGLQNWSVYRTLKHSATLREIRLGTT
jgi:hypothetical protein